MGVNPYRINIIGLTNKIHSFDFELNDDFFVRYGRDLIGGGSFKATVLLNKNDTFIDAEFKLKGQAALICDRSLDPFDYAINIDRKVVFKYGEEEQELSDDIYIITHDTPAIDLGQLMYEFIALEIPIRKLHPRFQEEESEDEDEQGKVIYTSSTEKESDDDIDPRWEQLKKLK